MSSTTLATVASGIALIAGAVFGAWLTGWFTVRVKQRQRVQQRRAEVYVDLLAWIGARMPYLRSEPHAPAGANGRGGEGSDGTQVHSREATRQTAQAPADPAMLLRESARLAAQALAQLVVVAPARAEPGEGAGPAQLARQPSADEAVAVAQAPSAIGSAAPAVKKRTTCPDASAMLARVATDPDTEYFISLQARVAVFASHDMARAFDNWVDAYRLVRSQAHPDCEQHPDGWLVSRIADLRPDCASSALRALVYERSTRRKILYHMPPGDPNRKVRRYFIRRRIGIAFWFRTTIRRRHDACDGLPGGLTRAVELCAAEELRKG